MHWLVEFAIVLLALTCFVSCDEQADLESVFDPKSGDGYQRRYTVDVKAKADDCFYIEDVQEGQVINLHYMVVNVDKRGQNLDIIAKFKGPKTEMLKYFPRSQEGQLIGYVALGTGDYQLCMDNRYSYFESKRIFWRFEVEGAEDEALEATKNVTESLEGYMVEAKQVKSVMSRVRTKVARMKGQQWRIEQNMKKDSARADALQNMVDRWSVIHALVVIAVGVCQLIFLRRMFSMKPTQHGMRTRT